MRRFVIVSLALLLCFGIAYANVNPVPAPATGTATQVDGEGNPVEGGEVIPFHLMYAPVPPALWWGGAQLPCTVGGGALFYSNVLWNVPPFVTIEFLEDDYGRIWARRTVTTPPGAGVITWFRVGP